MQFQVPQFIEVEDKIFGQLTFKQFVYMAGGAGLAYIMWRILPMFLAAPFVLAFLGFGAALAFMKYNGQPFIQAIEHAFFYFVHSKLYLWSNEQAAAAAKKQAQAAVTAQAAAPFVPKLSESRLHELAWSLDIKERIASGTASDADRSLEGTSDIVAPIKTSRDALVR